jgi:hypothetical protein
VRRVRRRLPYWLDARKMRVEAGGDKQLNKDDVKKGGKQG